MNLTAPESNIVLPEDLQAAIERANANLVIVNAQHQNILNASASLKNDIQRLTDEKGHLEEKVAILNDECLVKENTLTLLTANIQDSKESLKTIQDQEKEIKLDLINEQNRINDERKVLDTEMEIVAKQKADLAIRESKLSEAEETHKFKVQKLQAALS